MVLFHHLVSFRRQSLTLSSTNCYCSVIVISYQHHHPTAHTHVLMLFKSNLFTRSDVIVVVVAVAVVLIVVWWRTATHTDCVYKYQINMQIFGNVKILAPCRVTSECKGQRWR